ncbi:MAG: tRNA (N6-isopentenyl adenosine(37)-C2)-methylthiotransferase MiaB, partial [Thermodesulfovibrionales bacterium]
MKKFYLTTFGCQMNLHDSEKMAGILSNEGLAMTDNPRDADVIIFNTCSIREKAEQKFFSELGRIKHLKRKKPDLKIAVAGCIAQHRGEEIFKRASHVDIVFGPQNIYRLKELLMSQGNAIANEDNPYVAEIDLPVLRRDQGRAWVSIMYGCDNFCSYC